MAAVAAAAAAVAIRSYVMYANERGLEETRFWL
jgi:hypothetical protein